MFSALRSSIGAGGMTAASLRADALAGLTVGIIALPLSMALAIAVGVAPQHGLYTAIVGGILIALTGGSRFNISGPTAAFVVILLPIVSAHGIGGLLVAGLMSGLILVGMGAARMGSLIAVMPYPVTVGFTAGIGTVIGLLQLKDLLGLELPPSDPGFLAFLRALPGALPSLQLPELVVGLGTLAAVLGWQRLRSRVPAHLIGLAAGVLLAWLPGILDPDARIDTIGSRFAYTLGTASGQGIPPLPPQWILPWTMPDASGQPLGISVTLLVSLLPSALAIAMLGALESLLCATVADGMTGTRHDPNDELIGQGIGNLLVPFLGGIPATAALARTAANIRAGAGSPLSAVVHGLFLLLALLVLAPALAVLPMASMAALLLVVAWNMADVPHFLRILRVAPREDAITLVVCYALTVLVNMEVAVGVGLGLAAFLFIRRTVALTDARLLERHAHPHAAALPAGVVLYDIDGPLFFGAAQKALSGLARLRGEVHAVVLEMRDVTMMDMTAIVALESIVAELHARGIRLVASGLSPRIVGKLRHAGLDAQPGKLDFVPDIESAVELLRS